MKIYTLIASFLFCYSIMFAQNTTDSAATLKKDNEEVLQVEVNALTTQTEEQQNKITELEAESSDSRKNSSAFQIRYMDIQKLYNDLIPKYNGLISIQKHTMT
jgi:hypothetical protein